MFQGLLQKKKIQQKSKANLEENSDGTMSLTQLLLQCK